MARLFQRGLDLLRRILALAQPREDTRYRQLFENVPDGVYESSPDGRILAANRALVWMLGYESAGQLKREINARQLYVDPRQRSEYRRNLERQGSLSNVELELIRRDGRRITVLESAYAVRGARGGVLHYQGTLTDITERKAAERELMRARDKALEASRLKSEFLANMSHELRTPLNAVVGMASLLVESPLEERQAECAGTILDSARFLMDIIGELLDFSRIEAGRLELEHHVFRLRRTVEEAAAMLGSRASAGHVEVICHIHADVPELVAGDGARLQQVLTNLIGNAIKFTKEGEVVVSAAPGQDGRIRFEVADTGIGIDEEARAIIFEPFRQADGSTTRKYGGTGLGLAIARQIVEAMGGRLECARQPGPGSVFWFELAFQPAPGCRGGKPVSARVLHGKRAALLEPNESARRIMSEWLRSWGMQVADFRGGTADFDVCLVAADTRGSLACAQEEAGVCPAPWGKCLRLLPFAQNPACAGSHWAPALVVSKPLRQLDLLAALMRLFEPAREDTSRALLPLSRQLAAEPPRLRILAAEDNRINQRVITRPIERLGHTAHVVNNGSEVLAAAEEESFDLVLMDCQMPAMDGLEATAALRRSGRRIPVVGLTANAVPGDREACLAAGMNDYLSKPVVLGDLAVVLDRWCARSRTPGEERPVDAYPAIE